MADLATVRLARQGATRMFRVCLSLEAGDRVALFYDESTVPSFEVLRQAARDLKLVVCDRFVPRDQQRLFSAHNRLSSEDQTAIDSARGVCLCVSAGRDGLAYRKAIVTASVDIQRYVAVLPGVTLNLLSEAVNIDYVEVQQRCEDLAVALLLGDRAVLTSYAAETGGQSAAHQVSMNLGRFARSPITSTGIVPRGTWGNIPGGETFISPLEQTGNGTFVLNGAFKDCVLAPGQSIVLTLADGVLVDASGPGAEVAKLKHVLGWPPGDGRDPLGLAELGVGVNRGIKRLTGSALLDEKKAGTVHIAIGDNSEYGGLLRSYLHEDLVTVSPSLEIDGKAILDRGEFVLDANDWRERRDDALNLGAALRDNFIIRRTPTHAAPDRSRRLRVRRDVGKNRQCSYTVGSDQISADLGELYALIPPMPEEIWFSLIEIDWHKVHTVASPDYLKGLLAILQEHELVTLSSSDD